MAPSALDTSRPRLLKARMQTTTRTASPASAIRTCVSGAMASSPAEEANIQQQRLFLCLARDTGNSRRTRLVPSQLRGFIELVSNMKAAQRHLKFSEAGRYGKVRFERKQARFVSSGRARNGLFIVKTSGR